MKGFTWKVAIILAVVALAVVGLGSKPPRLGIDLRGGAELLFRIDTSDIADGGQTDLTETTVKVVRDRIDPTAQKGLTIQSRDQHRILMQLPGYTREETKEVINLATNLGKLEWRLVDKTQSPVKIENLKQGKAVPGYAWFPYSEGARQLAAADKRELPEGLLVVGDEDYNITGELLSSVRYTTDEMGGPAVSFHFKPEGAKRFSRMTGEHVGEQIAIILNDQVYSAPVVRDRIAGDGIISGIQTQKEAQDLVTVLNSGSLKAPLVLESEQYVGPTLGAATIRSAINAGMWAAAAVVAFMLVYYMFAGAIANVALTLNIVILLGVMIASGATITLPGIAGIILTIGMAVDANVLIFERVREERRLGRELPVALRLGYEKAFSAIFDSNLTTFATAAILYVYGTGPVRGFAITLSIGILVSFFTAVFATRVIFELLARKGLLKDLKMLHILTRTHIPFMSYARYFVVGSVIAIAAGMSLFWARGRSNLDIDFTGGSIATLQLETPMATADVRKRIADAGYPEAQVQALTSKAARVEEGAEVQGGEKAATFVQEASAFAVRTQLQGQSVAEFEEKIGAAFADVAPKRAVDVSERRVSAINARNDPYYGGVNFEAQLAEPLPGAKIIEAIDAAGLPARQVDLYSVDEETGALAALPKDAPDVSIFAVRTVGIDAQALAQKLSAAFLVPNPFPDEISQIGPEVASEMAGNAIISILLAMGFIVIYIWFRFGKVKYGVAAVVALVHDVLFTLGAIAVGDALGVFPVGKALMLGGFKINLPIVAAILTIVGYSLNDTIVVFDRIRENMRLKTRSDWEIITGSINQTLSRTVLTSGTTLLVVFIMYLIGGPGIHAFAYVMLVGIVVGTYSSIFIASPILLLKETLRGKPIAEAEGKPVATTGK